MHLSDLANRCIQLQVSFPHGHVTVSGRAVLHNNTKGIAMGLPPFVTVGDLFLNADVEVEQSIAPSDEGTDFVFTARVGD